MRRTVRDGVAPRQEFAVPAPGRFAPLALLLTVAALALGVLAMPRQQATELPLLAAVFMLALLPVGPLVALSRRRISIDGNQLVVAATFYTRRVAVDALDLAQARILDLAEHTGYRPMLGINRFGLPGLRAGHYLLRNRSRAFCLLTRFERVLVLPCRDGRYLLISPDDPQALLSRLRALAEAPRDR